MSNTNRTFKTHAITIALLILRMNDDDKVMNYSKAALDHLLRSKDGDGKDIDPLLYLGGDMNLCEEALTRICRAFCNVTRTKGDTKELMDLTSNVFTDNEDDLLPEEQEEDTGLVYRGNPVKKKK